MKLIRRKYKELSNYKSFVFLGAQNAGRITNKRFSFAFTATLGRKREHKNLFRSPVKLF